MNDTTNDPSGENSTQPNPGIFLGSGGTLETRLLETRGAATGSEWARRLHEQFTRDRERLLDHAQSPWDDPVGDPVLRFCAASAGAGYLTDELRAAAARAYQQHPDDYDIVLGDLLPQDFTLFARDRLAWRNYFSNTGRTAADDWDVFSSFCSGAIQQIRALPTGISILDQRLVGLHGLTIIGGDKGVGKSSLALQVAVSALKSTPDLAAVIFALDMPKTKLYERMVCLEAGIDYRQLLCAGNSPAVVTRIAQAREELRRTIAPRIRVLQRDFTFDVDEYREGATPERRGITARSVMRESYELMRVSGTCRMLLVFDLFQKLDPHGHITDSAARDHYRLDVFSEVINDSMGPAQPNGFPILVTSEIRKDATRGELTRDDLKGDGRISSDADNILLMWPQSEVAATSTWIPTTLRVDKGREGVIRGDIRLWFEHQQFRFHESDPGRALENPDRPQKQASSADSADAQINPLAE